MKTLCAVSVVCVVAMLVLGASAGPVSAGEFYGWGSCGSCGGCGYGGLGGCGYGGWSGGCGYGACGSGGCGLCGGGVSGGFWIFGDYAPYILGHGPMYPAGDNATGFSYTTYGSSAGAEMVPPAHK